MLNQSAKCVCMCVCCSASWAGTEILGEAGGSGVGGWGWDSGLRGCIALPEVKLSAAPLVRTSVVRTSSISLRQGHQMSVNLSLGKNPEFRLILCDDADLNL